MSKSYRAGYVAIVGRPNVGKSTLINHLIEQKINITSRKPQTTRHNMLGIKSEPNHQIIFVDTPGIHGPGDKAINRYMNRMASSSMKDVDAIVFVVDKNVWTQEDEVVLEQVSLATQNVIIAVNKVDKVEDKSILLAHFTKLAKQLPSAEIVPVSALRETNLDLLEELIVKFLPESSEPIFPEDQVTDKSMRFMCAEIIREKIVRQLGAELPYETTVEIEQFKTDDRGLVNISALILTERDGQKRILIGDNGDKIKTIGTDARKDIETLLDQKVMLKLWVKVKSGWSDDSRALQSLGFDQDS